MFRAVNLNVWRQSLTLHWRSQFAQERETAAAGSKQGYYEVLGVPHSARQEEIKDQYLALVKRHHPDVEKSNEAVPFIFLLYQIEIIHRNPTGIPDPLRP